ncbi:polysaccharide biosynthesis C-terminal domain-containing protein [bacterium]|nr:polysaccharide biosynthesis C-terminal domain-containing protein [FCB group bacterium]MBL7190936.1 polysaccharide biosynthesis C-terminal domain-containing protein [bacterium]
MNLKFIKGRNLFALFDQALVTIYGFIYILIIVRTLPQVEMGYLMLEEAVRFFLSALSDGSIGQAQIKYLSGCEPEERGDIIATGLIMKLMVLGGAFILVFVFRGLFADLMQSPALSTLLLMAPLIILSKLLHNHGRHILVARQEYFRLFCLDLVFSLIFLSLLFGGKYLTGLDTAMKVLWVSVISGFAVTLALPLFVKGRWAFGRYNRMWARKQYIFARDIFINTAGYWLYQRTDQLMLGAMVNPVAVAVYSIAGHFFKVFQLLNEAFNLVVLPGTSKISRNKDILTFEENRQVKKLYFSNGIILQSLAALLGLFLFITADWLIVFLFGADYADAALVLKIMLIGLVAVPFARLAGSVIAGLGRPDICAKITWITGGINLALNFVLIPKIGMAGAAVSSSASLVCMLVMYSFVLKKKLSVHSVGQADTSI